MSELSSAIGFVVIAVLYITIGLLVIVGSIVVSRKLFSPRHEQIFYGLFLTVIAGFYLSFTAYFGENKAWALESYAVLVFLILGIMGTRISTMLIFGYLLHGIWDTIHEIHAHTSIAILDLQQLTAIPLAYGIFCATYDIGIAIYFSLAAQTGLEIGNLKTHESAQGNWIKRGLHPFSDNLFQ